jgi:acyl-CoA synthetase (AMP-forming)/AMP-acid ligase II
MDDERAARGLVIPDLLSAAARRFPARTAAIFSGRRTSYAELERRSGQVARRLRRLGVGPGHRVALLQESSLAALVSYWGVMKSGAASVDVSVLAGRTAVAQVLRECRATAIAISPRQLQRMTREGVPEGFPRLVLGEAACAPIAEAVGLALHSLESVYGEDEPETERPAIGRHDPAMVIYTSGSTGRPKGVMLSTENLISNVEAVNSLMGLTSEDSLLFAVPLNFIHGRMQLLTHTMIGGTLVFSAGFHMPQTVLKELAEHRVSGFSGVPYHFRTLLRRSLLATTELPHLRYVVVTGGPMAAAELRELSEALPGVEVHVAYGQTEAAPRICNLPAAEVLSRPDSCGRPIPGVTVEIADERGESVPPGAIGEVVVSGPNVMLGYVSGDEREHGTLDERGRLHTGDLGRMDESGYLFLVGRKSEMIKVAGERVFPGEIEAVINGHPAVQESAVVGVEDALLGEQIVAFVVLLPGVSLAAKDLRSHCLASLPFVRMPRRIEILEALPSTSSGKPDRRRLRALLAVERREGAATPRREAQRREAHV